MKKQMKLVAAVAAVLAASACTAGGSSPSVSAPPLRTQQVFIAFPTVVVPYMPGGPGMSLTVGGTQGTIQFSPPTGVHAAVDLASCNNITMWGTVGSAGWEAGTPEPPPQPIAYFINGTKPGTCSVTVAVDGASPVTVPITVTP